MTKDQKADTGGDPWESRRPLIHRWAPGLGPGTCELLWKFLTRWLHDVRVGDLAAKPSASPYGHGVCCSFSQSIGCAFPPMFVCLASKAAFSETACVRDVQMEEICADMSSLVCSERELLILLPHCFPASGLYQHPGVGDAPGWSFPSTVPSLIPCPQLLLPMADGVLGVGVQVNGDVWSPGMLLAWAWGDRG